MAPSTMSGAPDLHATRGRHRPTGLHARAGDSRPAGPCVFVSAVITQRAELGILFLPFAGPERPKCVLSRQRAAAASTPPWRSASIGADWRAMAHLFCRR